MNRAKEKTFYPDAVDCRAGKGLTVIRNPESRPLEMETGEWGLRYAALFVFDATGLLTEIGGYLLTNEEASNGSTQDRIRVPAGGFAVAFGDDGDPWLFDCWHEVVEDAVLYNSTLVPDHPLYASYDPESNELRMTLPAFTEAEEPAFKILFLGNSTLYFNGCPRKFRGLCRMAGIPVRVRYCTFGGAYLYQYADPDSEQGVFFRKVLGEDSYDYVILHDAQDATLEQAAAALRVLLPMIAENGARPLFLNRYYPAADPERYAEKAPEMEKLYRDLSWLFRIPASPAGKAFTICRERYPDIDLFSGDRSHHSSAGSYLIACTLLGTLFSTDASGNPYPGGQDPETAARLQACADEANREERNHPAFRYASAAQDAEAGSLEETQDLSLLAAEEGSVLLCNDGTLPLAPGSGVALFGRMQTEYIKSGTGSGGKVHAPFVPCIRERLIAEGLKLDEPVSDAYDLWIAEHPIDRGDGWSCPWNQEEMPLDAGLVNGAAARNETALYIIGRTAGEAKDCTGRPGSYYLTETEESNLRLLTGAFRRVAVLLNIGNQMDLSWIRSIPVSAVLCLWQGGMMGAIACGRLLTGRANPSGKLADTIALSLEDYPSDGHFGNPAENEYEEDVYVGYRYFETFAPDRVQFPFGFGLSYTTFSVVTDYCAFDGQKAVAAVWVTNTGSVSGKEVVQWYVSSPRDGIGAPARKLVGFAKTGLLEPGESEQICMHADVSAFASYDDFRNCWLLAEGEYVFRIGQDVRRAEAVWRFWSPERILKQSHPLLGPEKPILRRTLNGTESTPKTARYGGDPVPECKPYTGDRGIRLGDVADGKADMADFLAQIPDEQLIYMVRGEGMNSPKVTAGSAGAFGGVTDELIGFGIPILCAADGPSGVRLAGDATTEVQSDGTKERKGSIATALPNGTLLACTWNTDLVRELYFYEGIEIRLYDIDTILGPGINIHRHPLCGRNFEYFSECPVLTGKMASAALRGLDEAGIAGTIKHFFGNSQETNRVGCNAVMSERAAREIYVKAFEIAVREGGCRSVMTSYNPVNGLWSASNPGLTRDLLRGEWGFDGVVMTDWWANVNADEPGKPDMVSLQRMVRAQNDVYMPTPDAKTRQDRLEESLRNGSLTRSELVVCAEHICRFAMRTPAFLRMRSGEEPLARKTVSAEGFDELTGKDNPASGEEISVSGPTGLCVAEFVLRAKDTGDPLAQRTLLLRVDGACAATVTLSPSEGEQTVTRGFTMISGERKAALEYRPDELEVRSVRFLAPPAGN